VADIEMRPPEAVGEIGFLDFCQMRRIGILDHDLLSAIRVDLDDAAS
jgi:hypothetical protein